MSYPDYNAFSEPMYGAPAPPRDNIPSHSNYEGPGPSRLSTYDRYVPNPDTSRFRSSYGDSYRPENDSYRPGNGDSYRPESWMLASSSHSGDHYEPAAESDDWRGQDSWGAEYQPQYPERERKGGSIHWEPDHRDTMAERMFEPSEAWVSSHSSRGAPRNNPDQYPPPRIRDYRSTSPVRRSRDDYGPLYASPTPGDFYRPEPPPPSTTEIRYARPADCYRPAEETFIGSSYTPDVQPGPHWRRGRSPSPRARVAFEGSHWDPDHDRSFSGSISRSHSRSRSRERRPSAPHLRPRSRSSSLSSAPRSHILPSRPLRVGPLLHRSGAGQPTLSITTGESRSYVPDQASPSSAKLRQLPHPSLPPRPMPMARDRAHYTGEDTYSGQGARSSSPNDQRKRKTRRGGQGRRRHPNMPNGQSPNYNNATSPALWPTYHSNGPSVPPPLFEPAAKAPEPELILADKAPKRPVSDSSDSVPVAVTGAEPLPKPRSPPLLPKLPPPSPLLALNDSQRLHPASASSPMCAPAPASIRPEAASRRTPQSENDNEPPRATRDVSLRNSVSPPVTLQPAAALVASPTVRTRFLGEPPVDTSVTLPLEEAPIQDHTSAQLGDLPAVDIPATTPPVTTADEDFEPSHSSELPRSAESLQDALQMIITARKAFDKQTRQERIAPIFLANRELIEHRTTLSVFIRPADISDPTPDQRVKAREYCFGEKMERLLKDFTSSHRDFVQKRQESLRSEYLSRHKAWVKHCEELDQAATQALSASASLEDATAASGGRTTRRSAAVVGDTVRSDLEMEQIIASLGNEDLFDPAILATKNGAKIPDMISVIHGRVETFFDDTNGAVDDPASFYDSGPGVAAWTEEEERIYVEQYAANPKQFGKIAEALPNKSPSECVLFYYLHKKKLVDFRKAITTFGRSRGRGRGRGTKKKGNALLADIRAHDAEVRDGSVDDDGNGKARKRRAAAVAAASIATGANAGRRGPRRSALAVEASAIPGTATPTPEPEARPKRRRAVKIAQEGVDLGEGSESERPVKKAKRGRKPRASTLRDEDDAEESGKGEARRKAAGWTDADKMQFIELLSRHGDNWEVIAAGLGNKTPIQVMAFYKANMVELQLDGILDTYKRKKGLPSDTSFITASPLDAGTPASDPPTTAAHSAAGSPAPQSINLNNNVPMLVGPKVYPYGFPPQPPAGGWPMAPLGSNPVDFLVQGVYQVPHGYPSTSSTTPYQYANHHLRLS